MDYKDGFLFYIGIVLVFALNMFDFFITCVSVNLYGATEVNPVVVYLLSSFIMFFIAKLIGSFISIYALIMLRRMGLNTFSFGLVWLFSGGLLLMAIHNILVFIHL